MKNALIMITFLFVTSCSSMNSQKEINKTKSDLYFAEGTERLVNQEYTEALRNLIQADELDPDNSKIINNLAMAYYFKGKAEMAKNLLNKSMKLDPKNSDAKNNLASIYFNEKKYLEAKKLYEEITADLLYGHTYRVYYNLALIELEFNNREKAITLLEQAIGNRIDYCPAGYRLATLYKEMGQYKKSLDTFKDTTKENCAQNPEPFYEWANLLHTLGKDTEALIKYTHVLEKFPSSPLAQNAANKINQLKKDTEFSTNQVDHVDTFKSGDF